MRSRFPSLAVCALAATALSSLGGCGSAPEARTPAYSPTPGAYPQVAGYPSQDARADGDRAIRAEAKTRTAFGSDDLGEEALDKAPAAPAPMHVSSTATGSAGGSGASSPAPPPPPPQQVPRAAQPSDAKKAPKPDPTQEPAQARDLVIYTARFTMAVYQVDQGLTAVEKIARDNGGYLGQKKDREITVRVPRGRFETTLAAVDKIGDVIHREIDAQDVTDEHVDLEIRIKNARAMQHRLTDLLTKASVKDALEIEKELHRVTEELERLEGRMKVLKDRVAFSTITVTFAPRGARIEVTRARLPFPWLGALNLPSLLSLSEEK
ncbi:MAG: DUF4349 domain-containing protein [Labilithrix sp.]|nr:DUF4349 domain-containing protein [Labilithrix sp.]